MDCGSGNFLIFHPDILLQHMLANSINHYVFFDYAVNEALHLSAEEEEDDLITILHKIDKECRHIDSTFRRLFFLTRKSNN